MDRSYPYTRRQVRRTRLRKRFAAVAAAGVAGCAVLYALMAPAPAPAAAPLALAMGAAAAQSGTAPAQVLKPGQRRVYPYSIVPGGVSGAQELGRVIREDKVVAAHYAEFDMARAREKTVTSPRAVYVSYRKGDKVYWTAKKVMLAEGETLLSDGSIEARARCANQISSTPRLPVEAHGPSAEALDSSVVENGPAAESGLENVSMAMAEGEGVPGGFLYAPGSGSAGGILAGGGALERESLFAAAAHVPGPSSGAFLSSRSSSSRGAPGKGAGESPGGSSDGDDSGSDGGSDSGSDGGSNAGGTPAASDPATGTTGDDGSGTPSKPAPQPATPESSTPGSTPGDGDSPTTPSNPGLPSPARPDGGQSGGGGSGTPSQPPTDIGSNPTPGGPDGSPVPEPSLDPPKEPVQPGQQPGKPVEVPEPGSLWLVAPVLALLLILRRRKRRGQAVKQAS